MRPIALVPVVALCACAAQAEGARRTRWEVRDFTWVKLVPREKGAEPSSHPAPLDREALKRGLGDLRSEGEALFDPKELNELLNPLQEAFAAARPEEDLVLLSTHRRGAGFMGPALAVTARLFVAGGKVNVIVHDARLDFMDRALARDQAPSFVYGSRTEPSKVILTGAYASKRGDWAAFPAVAPAPAAEPSRPPAPWDVKTPDPGGAAGTPEQRLRNLNRLREQNLITEEEYQRKRKEILDTL